MTSLFGSPNERWPLSRAVDAMVASARRAGFPALIWFAGLAYPSLSLGIGVVTPILAVLEATTEVDLHGYRHVVAGFLSEWSIDPTIAQPTLLSLLDPTLKGTHLLTLFLLLPLTLAVARLSAGLAQLSEEESWKRAAGSGRTPKLRETWKAGAGLSISAFGLVLTFPLLSMAAVLFLLGPVVLLLNLFEKIVQFPTLLALLLVPVGLIAMIYCIVLQVLIQLALHSLARNRRGCASALTHAWRMVRNSPWGAARATLVDLVVQTSLLVLVLVLDRALGTPGVALGWILLGFIGVVRAGYWAETYEGLGGLSTARLAPQPASAGA